MAEAALAYTLTLPGVLGAVLGIRLGSGSDHRAETMRSLELAEEMTVADRAEIEAVVHRGKVKDGLERT